MEFNSMLEKIDGWDQELQEMRGALLASLLRCRQSLHRCTLLLDSAETPEGAQESRGKRNFFVAREVVASKERQLRTAVRCIRLAVGAPADDEDDAANPPAAPEQVRGRCDAALHRPYLCRP